MSRNTNERLNNSLPIMKDPEGFVYYDFETESSRTVLIRSIDIAYILGVERKGTALELPYIDLFDTVMLAMSTEGKEGFAFYLNDVFHGDHMHASPKDPARVRIVPDGIKELDDEWSKWLMP